MTRVNLNDMPREHAWAPQPGPQTEAIIATWCNEILFGGARGGGKTDYLLGDYLQDVFNYKQHWQGILFRRSYPELSQVIQRSKALYPETGAEWKEGKHEWHWPNGAILRFRHLDTDNDAMHYQGHGYPWIGWDELGNWATATTYNMIKACCRSGDAEIPTKRIRSTANPGGPGHSWVKSYFVDLNALGYDPYKDPQTKWWRMFIPARVQDNKILLKNDPGYIDALKGVGSPALVRAWLEGDWSAIQGAYFPEFSLDRHVIPPFNLPEHWTRFRAFDWGSSAPYACLWLAVSDGTYPEYPPGCLIVYKELYGSASPNVGLKHTVPQVAELIHQTNASDDISYSVADPAIFKQDGGPSLAEGFMLNKVIFRPADNTRIPGWVQMRQRLIGLDNKPMLKIFSTCSNLIRTLPAMQHDPAKPEDLNTNSEDHCLHGDTLIVTDKGLIPIKDLVGTEGKVLTLYGFRSYYNCRQTQPYARIIKCTFNDGTIIICTPDHRFMTKGEKWVEAQHLVVELLRVVIPEDLTILKENAPERRPLGVVCVRIDEIGGSDVYCMTVPSTGHFIIQGGLVSANCLDALRYGLMSRPWTKPQPKPIDEIRGIHDITVDELWQNHTQQIKKKRW